MRPWVALALLLAACGDDRVLAPVTLHTGDSPLIAIDPMADGHWQRLPPNVHVTVEVGPRWIAATVCNWPIGPAVVYAHAYSDLDGDDITLPCRAEPDNLIDVPVTVSGDTWATFEIGEQGGGLPEGTADVGVLPGTWDVVAETLGVEQKLILAHDVQIVEGAGVLLDFDRDGFEPELHAVETTGALEYSRLYAGIVPGAGRFFEIQTFFFPESMVGLVPRDRLDEDDRQWVEAYSDDDAGAWVSAWRVADGESTLVDLRAPLRTAEIDLGSLHAAWSADPQWRDASLGISFLSSLDPGSGYVGWSYSDDTAVDRGEISFPDVSEIPGWLPAWSLPTDRDLYVSVELSAATDDSIDSIGWSQTFPPE